ncbi:MAG TPA: hypothetical protein DEO70_05555 [Bacteroidales bacterium]|nr:MAG: hypothetical protein A2X11_16865 [Bacteroidetes bacterium GWE2_42_24]OFY25161.1 MAG: hypothetical protein A2X09_05025 [Bacteroidetes bacterium GWF2_43_11]PKP27723.1 MAG: hypothetical protein CVU06_01205 [Bacteroidetes bacterium HGW-Bacteroidetes-22]HBZ66285.1 hypothetical protein [Bacteroidales bacterium]
MKINAFFTDYAGKIGNISVYNAYGQNIARTLPGKPKKKARGRKLECQKDFGRVMRVLQRLADYIRIGFSIRQEARSAFAGALSANIKRMNQSEQKSGLGWLLISKGQRAGATKLTVEQSSTTEALVCWDDPVIWQTWSGNDVAMVAAVNDRSLEVTGIPSVVTRSQKQASITLPPAKPGDTIWFFIGFYSLEELLVKTSTSAVSDSQLIGTMMV